MRTFASLTMTVLLAAPATTASAVTQVQSRTGAVATVQTQVRSDVRTETHADARGEAQGEVPQDAARESVRPAAGSLDVEAVLRATAEAGLPEAPVRNTVAEGWAKGAAEVEVARAASRTQGRLLLAREALESQGNQASQEEISLGAEALLQGATRVDLERIGGAAPAERSLETSLRALLSLQAEGHAVSEASKTIAAQLAAGASDLSLASLSGLNVVVGVAGALQGGGGSGASAAGSLTGSAAATAASAASGTAGVVQIGAGLTGSIGVVIVP
jgi:hypothetical protein